MCVCVFSIYVYIYNHVSICDLLFLPSKLVSVRTQQLCPCNCRKIHYSKHLNVHSEKNKILILFFCTCVTPSDPGQLLTIKLKLWKKNFEPTVKGKIKSVLCETETTHVDGHVSCLQESEA